LRKTYGKKIEEKEYIIIIYKYKVNNLQ